MVQIVEQRREKPRLVKNLLVNNPVDAKIPKDPIHDQRIIDDSFVLVFVFSWDSITSLSTSIFDYMYIFHLRLHFRFHSQHFSNGMNIRIQTHIGRCINRFLFVFQHLLFIRCEIAKYVLSLYCSNCDVTPNAKIRYCFGSTKLITSSTALVLNKFLEQLTYVTCHLMNSSSLFHFLLLNFNYYLLLFSFAEEESWLESDIISHKYINRRKRLKNGWLFRNEGSAF